MTETPFPTVKSVKALKAVEPEVVAVLTVTVFGFAVPDVVPGKTVVAVICAPLTSLGVIV